MKRLEERRSGPRRPRRRPNCEPSGKFERFLAGQDEEIALALLEMLPLEIRVASTNFYKLWSKRWQLHVSTCEAIDLTATLVNQEPGPLEWPWNVGLLWLIFSQGKSPRRIEAEASRAEKIKDASKLDSTLAEIEALKRKVHES